MDNFFKKSKHAVARSLDPKRLKQVIDSRIKIADGANSYSGNISPGKRLCIMEAVAYIIYGDGNITDAPPCTSEAIRRFCIDVNDTILSNRARAKLKNVIPEIINTAPTIWKRKRVWDSKYGHKHRTIWAIVTDDKDADYKKAEKIRNDMVAIFYNKNKKEDGNYKCSMNTIIEFIRSLAEVAHFSGETAKPDGE